MSIHEKYKKEGKKIQNSTQEITICNYLYCI